MSGRGIADAATDVLTGYVQEILVPLGRYARIRELVTSIDYVTAKALRMSPELLANDVRAGRRLAPDPAASAQLRVLEDALRQAARLIADDPGQLYGQLLARVPRGVAPDLDQLLDAAARWRERHWLRPLLAYHGDQFLRSFGPVLGFAGAVTINDDATVILVGDGTGGLSAWDADSGTQLWAGNAGAPVTAVTYRPGSFEAVVALADGTVARWSLADRRVRAFARHPDRRIEALTVDGDMVLYCAGKAVQAYDLAAGTPLWQGERHAGDVRGVAILGDGERCVSVSDDNILAIWRRQDGQFLGATALPADQPLCVTSVPGRPLAVLGTRNRRVITVDVDTGLATVLRGHANQVCSVSALPDGRVLSGSYDGQVLIWDLPGKSSRRVGAHAGWCVAVAAPRRPGPFVSGAEDGIVRVWSPDGPEVSQVKKVRVGVRALVVGAGTAYASYDRGIRRLDLATATALPGLAGHRGHIDALAISPEGRLVSGSADKDIRLWDLESGTSTALPGHTVAVDGLAVTPDGAEIISVSRDETWRRWSLINGTAGPVVRGSEPFGSALAVSPDGALVVTVTQEHTVEVWDRRKGRHALPPLYGHTGYVEHLAFTPDGRTLLSGSWDHTLRVWDLATGKERACFEHPAWVSDLVLTCDGDLAITAYGGINAFDLRALEPREPFTGHDTSGSRSIVSLALAPDDRTLFSISDRTVRAWDVATRAQLAAFPAEASLRHVAAAGPDLVVAGTADGVIIAMCLERARTRARVQREP